MHPLEPLMSTPSKPRFEVLAPAGETTPPTSAEWVHQTLKALSEQHPGWDFLHFTGPYETRWQATHKLSGERREHPSLNTVLKLIEITDTTYAKVRGEERA